MAKPQSFRLLQVWRGFLGRRKAADRRQDIRAAILLQRRLRGAQVFVLYRETQIILLLVCPNVVLSVTARCRL